MGAKYTAVVYRAGTAGLMGEKKTDIVYRTGTVG
jgi:hypothetical protein